MPRHPHLWIKPGVSWGRPSLRGTGLSAENMFMRWDAGETVVDIAEDYSIEPLLVEVAIAFHLGRSRSKAAREALEP